MVWLMVNQKDLVGQGSSPYGMGNLAVYKKDSI